MTEVNLAKLRLPHSPASTPPSGFEEQMPFFKNASITSEETRANCVLEIIPETVLETIAPWLDMQPDVLEYSKLKEWILKVFLSINYVIRFFFNYVMISFFLNSTAQLEQLHDVKESC